MRNYYEHYKYLHDSIKPIKGRAEDVRPIGKRRRDHERIEMDGDVVACRLYNTQCVRYYPDGRIGLRTDSWATPLTADFIHTHSPWQCFKRHRKLWIMVPTETDKYMHYPVPEKGELQFQVDGAHWQPVGDVVIEKRVVDRDKAKEARAPIKPFLAWAKVFMALSDGWLMHETRKVAQGINKDYPWCYDNRYKTDAELLEMMTSNDEEKYLLALCCMFDTHRDYKDRRVANTEDVSSANIGRGMIHTWYDCQYGYKQVYNKANRITKNSGDVYKTVQAKVESHPQTGIA